ncbi:hypothetical protein FACUT_8366 [Fusarium acutatum]|uniref:Uncharacterized protein n=1 Tax=Fusarium acutatum TaxID=78861 RepID=A0A8H4JMZ4_9HYPO|nr:hypothetical protein FACUT_8366 [Fusarium acutatum]
MVTLKTSLALLCISAVSAIPTSAQWPKYDANGQLQDLAFDRRAPVVCQPDDKNIVALKSHKADGSAFCSTYLQSTKTITATPLVTSDMTKVVTKTAMLLQIQKVRINVYHIVRTKVMKTISTVVTDTKTATITDFATKTITDTMTDVSTDTDTTQVTKATTERLTDVVTEQVTKTITTTIDLTSTMDVTDVDTQDVTMSVPTTLTVTVTGAAPTTSVSLEYHCAIEGYGNSIYMTSLGGPGAYSSWGSLHAIATACQPRQRAVPVKQVPSYLPIKDLLVVSSACSCHISNKPAAATTQTVTAKEPKTVTNMAKEYTTSYITKKKVTTVYNQVTRTATDFKTLAVTNRNTKSVTQRKSATMTKPTTITVTNYKTVVVTNYNTVGVTNRNTIQTTNYNTASATAYNSVFVTNVDYLTVTEYDTVMATDIATNTVIPDAVTVAGGDTYVWGS